MHHILLFYIAMGGLCVLVLFFCALLWCFWLRTVAVGTGGLLGCFVDMGMGKCVSQGAEGVLNT